MPQPIIMGVAEFAPDMPEFIGQGSANILNVLPRTPKSYGPCKSLAATRYGALDARCQGATAFSTDNSATVFPFAGSASNLYRLDPSSSSAWENVSKSVAAYNVAATDQWQFAYFNGDVLAVNYADNPQAFTIGSSTAFADLGGSPPKAKYIAVVKNAFVVVGNTDDASNGAKPQRIWWSGAGTDNQWPTPGTTTAAQLQSGAVDLLGPAGMVMGIASDLLYADAVIFQQFALRRMEYQGPPTTWQFTPVDNARGTPAPYSIVSYGGVAYYFGQDGFYAFDGAQAMPIGRNRVDRYFLANIATSNFYRIIGSLDPLTQTVLWAWPSPSSPDGNPDKILCYNFALDRWSLLEIACETLARMMSIGYTLDELNTVLGYTSLDQLPAPLDSPIWQGGALQLGVFDTTHQLGFLTGANLAATVALNETQPFLGKRALVRGVRPFVDSGVPSVSLGHRERLEDAVVYTADSALNSLGACPLRASGRYLRPVIKMAAGASWTHISGAQVDAQPLGIR